MKRFVFAVLVGLNFLSVSMFSQNIPNPVNVRVVNTTQNPVPTNVGNLPEDSNGNLKNVVEPSTNQYQFITVTGIPCVPGICSNQPGDIIPNQSQWNSYPTVAAVLTYLSTQGYELVSAVPLGAIPISGTEPWMVYTLRASMGANHR